MENIRGTVEEGGWGKTVEIKWKKRGKYEILERWESFSTINYVLFALERFSK